MSQIITETRKKLFSNTFRMDVHLPVLLLNTACPKAPFLTGYVHTVKNAKTTMLLCQN